MRILAALILLSVGIIVCVLVARFLKKNMSPSIAARVCAGVALLAASQLIGAGAVGLFNPGP